MANRFNASGESMSRTAGLPAIDLFTMMAWARIVTDTNAFASILTFGDTTGGQFYSLSLDADGTTLLVYEGSAGTTGSALSVGTWYHVALTCAGTGANGLLGYLNGVLDITETAIAGADPQLMMIGNDSFDELFNGRVAAIKVWNAVLTAAEIRAEMFTYMPRRWANLNCWSPCFSGASERVRDYSPNGNNWTANGTLSDEDGPPIAWGPRAVMVPVLTSLTPVSQALTLNAERLAAVQQQRILQAEHTGDSLAQTVVLPAEHVAPVQQSRQLRTEHLLGEQILWQLLSEHLAGVQASKAFAAEHMVALAIQRVLATEHVASLVRSRTLAAEHVTPVVRTVVIPTEHRDPDQVLQTLVIHTEHLNPPGGVTQTVVIPTEHLATIAPTVELPAEHLLGLEQTELVAAEHVSELQRQLTLPAEHLLSETMAWVIGAEHLGSALRTKLVPTEHLARFDRQVVLPTEHVDPTGTVSRLLTLSAEHLAAVTRQRAMASEHLASIDVQRILSAEHLLDLVATRILSAEHMLQVPQAAGLSTEHLAAVRRLLTLAAEHTLEGLVYLGPPPENIVYVIPRNWLVRI